MLPQRHIALCPDSLLTVQIPRFHIAGQEPVLGPYHGRITIHYILSPKLCVKSCAMGMEA